MGEAVASFASPPVIISEVLSTALSSIYLFVVSAAIFRVLHGDPDRDDPTRVRDGP